LKEVRANKQLIKDNNLKKALRFFTVKSLCFSMLLIFLPLVSNGEALALQDTVLQSDTVKVKKVFVPSPRKAALLSATIPGMGQIYNRKYWKVPIVYAGFGALGYAVYFNNKYYQSLKMEYAFRIGGYPESYLDPEYSRATNENVKRVRDSYRRDLELSYIGVGVFYLLTILDATVDAHLADFDVGEDLSLHLSPQVQQIQGFGLNKCIGAGLSLSFRF